MIKATSAQSRARKNRNMEYLAKAKLFLALHTTLGAKCPVASAVPALKGQSRRMVQIHHRYGRLGALLLWEPGWMAVSVAGHAWIHAHPAEARRRGWLAECGQWNDFRAAQKSVEAH